MKERPIIMSGSRPQEIIDGLKTQTRRPIKYKRMNDCDPVKFFYRGGGVWIARHGTRPIHDEQAIKCPYGMPGDRLWVREAWRQAWPKTSYSDGVVYRADARKSIGMDEYSDRHRWKPSIHMPRWASRILLEVTDVRVERVQDISAADIIAEGIKVPDGGLLASRGMAKFRKLWDRLYAKKPEYQWDKNVWVWVVEFKVVK